VSRFSRELASPSWARRADRACRGPGRRPGGFRVLPWQRGFRGGMGRLRAPLTGHSDRPGGAPSVGEAFHLAGPYDCLGGRLDRHPPSACIGVDGSHGPVSPICATWPDPRHCPDPGLARHVGEGQGPRRTCRSLLLWAGLRRVASVTGLSSPKGSHCSRSSL